MNYPVGAVLRYKHPDDNREILYEVLNNTTGYLDYALLNNYKSPYKENAFLYKITDLQLSFWSIYSMPDIEPFTDNEYKEFFI